jgi:hypothetical protein
MKPDAMSLQVVFVANARDCRFRTSALPDRNS